MILIIEIRNNDIDNSKACLQQHQDNKVYYTTHQKGKRTRITTIYVGYKATQKITKKLIQPRGIMIVKSIIVVVKWRHKYNSKITKTTTTKQKDKIKSKGEETKNY